MSSKYTPIGKINKPLGTQGEMKIFIEDIFLSDLLESDHIFVKIKGSFVPYFIEDMRESNHLLIKIEEIDDPESTLALVNKEIFLKTSMIHSSAFSSINEKQGYEGYTILDKNERVGIVETIELMPQQVIAWVVVNQKRIAIPLAEGLIQDVDDLKKKIYMDLPEGILDL
ncbi:MAG: hypothetical protein IPK35_04050 [Saprospiraceae bacterium]|jgi:16S rRNA processing protein RimM|nr:hypothetical protein [Saprospiraceae bacterium]